MIRVSYASTVIYVEPSKPLVTCALLHVSDEET